MWGWLVCVEYLNCYGCRGLEQLWSGNTQAVDLKHLDLEPNLPIIKYVAVESGISLTEMRLHSVSVQTLLWLRWMSTAPLNYLYLLLNRILDGDLEALQLLLRIPNYGCFIYCSSIASASAAAPQLHLL